MEGNLDTIVDEPLEGSQCTDHDDTGNKTLPDTLWTQFLQDLKIVMVRIWLYRSKQIFNKRVAFEIKPKRQFFA